MATLPMKHGQLTSQRGLESRIFKAGRAGRALDPVLSCPASPVSRGTARTMTDPNANLGGENRPCGRKSVN